MFEIEAARKRARKPFNSWMQLLEIEMRASYEDMRLALDRQVYGKQFWIPIHIKRRQQPQRYCDESMLGRLHVWEVTYYPAKPCWDCKGLLEVYLEGEDGPQPCGTCTAGWIPEKWIYKCGRCSKSLTKG